MITTFRHFIIIEVAIISITITVSVISYFCSYLL